MSFRIRLPRTLRSEEKVQALRAAGCLVGAGVAIGANVEIIGNQITLGAQVTIEEGAKLVFDTAKLGVGVRIGANADLRASDLQLENGVRIGHSLHALVAEKLRIGRNSYLGHSCEIVSRSVDIGEGLYCENGMIAGGGGGVMGPYSELTIGRFVHIGEFSVINTARPVRIGDEAGLGAHVMIYTHGMWPPALEGYPLTYGPVTIGAKVWITGRTVVLPGVTIGDGAVVAMGSVVSRNLPSRCLAGGSPAKVLREDAFGHTLAPGDKDRIMLDVLQRYVPELEFKGFKVTATAGEAGLVLQVGDVTIVYERPGATTPWLPTSGRHIVITWRDELSVGPATAMMTIFHLNTMQQSGLVDSISEDLRDFLRRNCVRFYSSDRFQSIQPPAFARLAKE